MDDCNPLLCEHIETYVSDGRRPKNLLEALSPQKAALWSLVKRFVEDKEQREQSL